MRHIISLLLLFAVVLGSAGLYHQSGDGSRPASRRSCRRRTKSASALQEHPKLVQQFGGSYDTAELSAYVDRVGQSLARFAEVQDVRYSFTVLDDDDINAFALPGGYVHVTRGLLALASNEAELAGVLGHEIGHITARHAAQRYSSATAANLGIGVLSILGTVAGLPPSVTEATGSGLQTGAAIYLQSYSRDQEMEADRLGIRYMTRAGYDPEAMVTFFRKLDAWSRLEAMMAGDPGAAERLDIMASHPRTADRVQQAAQTRRFDAGAGGRTEPGPYLKAIDGLLFGDSPSQGFRRGRDFIHPELRIAFRVPEGLRAEEQFPTGCGDWTGWSGHRLRHRAAGGCRPAGAGHADLSYPGLGEQYPADGRTAAEHRWRGGGDRRSPAANAQWRRSTPGWSPFAAARTASGDLLSSLRLMHGRRLQGEFQKTAISFHDCRRRRRRPRNHGGSMW